MRGAARLKNSHWEKRRRTKRLTKIDNAIGQGLEYLGRDMDFAPLSKLLWYALVRPFPDRTRGGLASIDPAGPAAILQCLSLQGGDRQICRLCNFKPNGTSYNPKNIGCPGHLATSIFDLFGGDILRCTSTVVLLASSY